MVVHLIDGTYELFRHFYGNRRRDKQGDVPFSAVAGVLGVWGVVWGWICVWSVGCVK